MKVNYTCVYICVCICYTISLADHQVVFHHHSLCFSSSQITVTFRNPVLFALMQRAWHTENRNTPVPYHNMKTEHCLCSDCLPKSDFFLGLSADKPMKCDFYNITYLDFYRCVSLRMLWPLILDFKRVKARSPRYTPMSLPRQPMQICEGRLDKQIWSDHVHKPAQTVRLKDLIWLLSEHSLQFSTYSDTRF